MYKTLALAAGLALTGAAVLTAPAMADAYCGPGFYYSRHTGECRPYAYAPPPAGVVGAAGATAGAAVGTAGAVAGSAVGAAGNVAGAAVGTAGNIVGCALGGCR
ncbi:MAG TPA: hypothetical protein VG651_15565 [Stellaceae bacterium]|nr:hypothetical protein [Stellaceae bacterium]